MTTIANQPTNNDAAMGKMMKMGTGSSSGTRASFLGTGVAPGTFSQVSAGTPGPASAGAGKNGTGMGSPAQLPGMLPDKAVTLIPSGQKMDEGKGGGCKLGMRGTFL